MRTAGARWRSGSDTCVFKPAVKCEGEADVRPGVSRVRKAASAARDLLVETRIREAFPALVESGAVSVYSHTCTPEFTAEDIATTADTYESGSGCVKLGALTPGVDKSLTNFVTPEVGKTFRSLLRQVPNLPNRSRTLLMKQAFQTAVDMVPDAGPWIVHADCHLNNVMMKDGKTVLSDWGRAVIVENPDDIESIRKGIKDWIVDYGWLAPGAPIHRFIQVITVDLHAMKEYPQHPHIVMDEIGLRVFNADPNSQDIARRAIRGWLLYVLIEQSLGIKDPEILTRKNQAELQAKLDEIITPILSAPPPYAALLQPQAVPVPLPPVAAASKPVMGGLYWPTKYSRGLTRKANAQRKRTATRRRKMGWKNPKAYVPFKSDVGIRTKPSNYTQRFRKRCPDATTLPQISRCTKVPTKTLRTVYNRGMAAWRTGHRPGASQHAWGMARVHSFVMKGKTYRTADKDLAKR